MIVTTRVLMMGTSLMSSIEGRAVFLLLVNVASVSRIKGAVRLLPSLSLIPRVWCICPGIMGPSTAGVLSFVLAGAIVVVSSYVFVILSFGRSLWASRHAVSTVSGKLTTSSSSVTFGLRCSSESPIAEVLRNRMMIRASLVTTRIVVALMLTLVNENIIMLVMTSSTGGATPVVSRCPVSSVQVNISLVTIVTEGFVMCEAQGWVGVAGTDRGAEYLDLEGTLSRRLRREVLRLGSCR